MIWYVCSHRHEQNSSYVSLQRRFISLESVAFHTAAWFGVGKKGEGREIMNVCGRKKMDWHSRGVCDEICSKWESANSVTATTVTGTQAYQIQSVPYKSAHHTLLRCRILYTDNIMTPAWTASLQNSKYNLKKNGSTWLLCLRHRHRYKMSQVNILLWLVTDGSCKTWSSVTDVWGSDSAEDVSVVFLGARGLTSISAIQRTIKSPS